MGNRILGNKVYNFPYKILSPKTLNWNLCEASHQAWRLRDQRAGAENTQSDGPEGALHIPSSTPCAWLRSPPFPQVSVSAFLMATHPAGLYSYPIARFTTFLWERREEAGEGA